MQEKQVLFFATLLHAESNGNGHQAALIFNELAWCFP